MAGFVDVKDVIESLEGAKKMLGQAVDQFYEMRSADRVAFEYLQSDADEAFEAIEETIARYKEESVVGNKEVADA